MNISTIKINIFQYIIDSISKSDQLLFSYFIEESNKSMEIILSKQTYSNLINYINSPIHKSYIVQQFSDSYNQDNKRIYFESSYPILESSDITDFTYTLWNMFLIKERDCFMLNFNTTGGDYEYINSNEIFVYFMEYLKLYSKLTIRASNDMVIMKIEKTTTE